MERKSTILFVAIALVLLIASVSAAAAGAKNVVARPVIANISPTFGSTAGGALILIQGHGFATGIGRSQLRFGSVGVAAMCQTTTRCAARTPPHRRGTAQVTLVTRAETSAPSALARFTYVAPTATASITTSLVLDETTVPTGTPISASFVVDNQGAAVLVGGCPEDSSVQLTNSEVASGGASAGVGCDYVVEAGTTEVSFTLPTTYQQCSENPAQATVGSPSCPPPPLPPGT
ncbi:MAG: IPT/TIG domain-containing protein, partial [Nitrososphaerales archaeon]